MLKTVTALLGALIAAWVLVGSATEASAGYGYRHHGCCGGGHIRPTYTYKTIKVYKHFTRYHDVWRTKYVKRIHKYVHVTRFQPIYNIHVVKRIHHRIVARVYPVHVWKKVWLAPKKYYSYSVKNIGCRCSYHHY
jgi:hypothetical protein